MEVRSREKLRASPSRKKWLYTKGQEVERVSWKKGKCWRKEWKGRTGRNEFTIVSGGQVNMEAKLRFYQQRSH